MAKKGGVQQLQADLNTDEEFEKFIERPGLLVLDIYSEWCGPCLGMVGSLKKIKLELGGDNLQLAICKSDTISYLRRFCKKSEPTWMFVTNGRATNLMFGTNVPKLMKLIEVELKELSNKNRTTYEIIELQPEEAGRKKIKEAAIAESIRIEEEERTKNRRDYLMYVTDSIIENLPDIGVTLFGPQVNRDMFKKIMEPADLLKIQCKDRKVTPVYKENFDIINFACNNQLSEEVIEQLDQKELLLCFWKIPDDSRQSIAAILQQYADELTKKRTEPDEFGDEDRVIPPILAPLDIKLEYELRDDEECIVEEEPIPLQKSARKRKASSVKPETLANDQDETEDDEGEYEDEGEEGDDEEEEEEGGGENDPFAMSMAQLDLDMGGDEEQETKEPEVVVEAPPQKRMCTKTVKIPPIWVPSNHRTHAAMIYVFFRQQTAPFLPPDPVPEPPHVIMAFDAYKKKDLIDLANRYKEDMPLYGFFTSDDADEAEFIANSAEKYNQKPHTASDKLVFKVNKKTSQTLLSLATYGPSYVSPNTVVGHEEALKFFPADYKTIEQEMLELTERESSEPRKRRKGGKKGHSTSGSAGASIAPSTASASMAAGSDHAVTTIAEVDVEGEAVTTAGEEGTTTTSGEESGDSMPPTAEDVAVPEPEAETAPTETTDAAQPKETPPE